MRKLLLALSIGVGVSSFAQKAFDEYKLDKNFNPFISSTNKALPSGNADASVSVNASNQINKVRQSVFGQNAVAWQGNINPAADRENHWKNANFSLLRYPGGNWSNIFFWDGNTPSTILTESALNGNVGNLKKGTDAWMLETDEFPDLLNHTGADGIVCVNVGYAFYGTSSDPVNTAADYAAAWVNEYNINQGLGIKYWELGNENYGPWQAGFDLANPQMYADACVIFAQKMKAVDPSIEIGVVLYEGEGGFNSTPQAKDWNEIVLPTVQDIADFLIIHHYPHPNTNQNAIPENEIYDAITVVDESMEMIHNQVETYTNKAGDYYPVATTEFNMRAGMRNTSRTNALFTTMMLAEYAKHDYGAVTQWDLQNGFNTETGDHGLVSSRDPFLDEGSVNPEFYAFYYMDRYFGDMVVGSSSNDPDIVTYATTFTSGELGLIVVNRGATDKVVDLSLNGYQAGNKMFWHTVDGDDSDFDRTVYINGEGPDKTFVVGQSYTSNRGSNDNTEVATVFEENGVSGPQDYWTIDPYSTDIPVGDVKFDAPKYSVSYIVFEGNTTGCLTPDLGPDVELCQETSVLLDATVTAPGATYAWTRDGESFGTAATIDVMTEGLYEVVVAIDGCPDASDQVEVTSNLLAVEGDTVCVSGDRAQLFVLEAGENYSWFDLAEGGSPKGFGPSYSPEITETTTFYVQGNDIATEVFGKSAIDGTTYGNTGATAYQSANRSTIVTVDQGLTLQSVKVFLQSASVDLVFHIVGNGMDETLNFNGLSGTEAVIDLDLDLTPGTYTIDLIGTTGGVKIQYSNPSDQSIPGLISFEVGGGNSDWYGMFYDWTVSTGAACARTPVVAVFDPQPGCITSVDGLSSNGLEVYPNPTFSVVNFSSTVSYELYDVMGAKILSGKGESLDLSSFANGMYVLKTELGNIRLMKK